MARRRELEHRKLRRDAPYDDLLERQGGVCGICRRTPEQVSEQSQRQTEVRRLDVDHHHKTMAVRGLLCRTCNLKLRKGITADWLEAAAAYLRSA